jgi:hypothetical protein
MQVNGHVPPPLHGRDRSDVIDVTVRNPDGFRRRIGRIDQLEYSFPFTSGVDDGATSGPLIDDEVAILLKRPDRE